MKVLIHKQHEGERTVNVVPSVRSQKKPVTLRHVTRRTLSREVDQILRAIAGETVETKGT